MRYVMSRLLKIIQNMTVTTNNPHGYGEAQSYEDFLKQYTHATGARVYPVKTIYLIE